MYFKIFLNSIIVTALAIFQISFVNTLPSYFGRLDIILVFLIFILVLNGLEISLYLGLGFGFLLDIYSFNPFGAYMISLFLTIILAKFLLINFFTNRSLYSFLALTGLSMFFYKIFYEIFVFLILLFFNKKDFLIFSKSFWINIFPEFLVNWLLVVIIFYSISFASNKLRPVFLGRTK